MVASKKEIQKFKKYTIIKNESKKTQCRNASLLLSKSYGPMPKIPKLTLKFPN